MPLVLLALLTAAACGKDSPPVPAPERAAENAPKTETNTPPASPADALKPADPSAAAKAPDDPAKAQPEDVDTRNPADPAKDAKKAAEPGADAKADPAQAPTPGGGKEASGKPAPEKTAPAIAADTKIAAPAANSSAPAAKNGILAPGEADKILAVGARPTVKLMSPGAEPRAPLSYELEQGSKHRLSMGMDMLMSIRMGDQAIPATSIPRIVMGLDMLIAEKGAEGDWKIDANLDRTSLEPKGDQQRAIADQMLPSIEGMKGMRMSYWVTPKGHVRDVQLKLPEGFPAQAQQMLQGMNQSFESMMAPLPVDPVGIGAKWEVVTRVASSGADLLQFATYTLKKKTGSKALLEVTVKQLAAKATVTAPGLPPGTLARLLAFKSEGSGTNEIDTKSVAPENGKMVVKSGMTLEVSGAGGPAQETTMETALTVTFTKPKK
jgi:hypothetical protein